jgi:heme exporter protein CcmD
MSLTLLLLWPLLGAATGDGFKPYVAPSEAGAISAPLFVLIAYAAIWVVLLIFLGSVWRRQRRVEEELHELQRRLEG